MAKKKRPDLRKRFPVVSGIFYPESPEDLQSRLVSWGLKPDSAASGGMAILAPHGAWDLTGSIAKDAFAAIQGKGGETGRDIKRVLLLGNCHRQSEEGVYLSESSCFETPLGALAVDLQMNRELASCSTLIKVNDIPHLSEHSIEVLLPLVKYCFPRAAIIPVLMSGRKPCLVSGLAKALRVILEKDMEESLIVVSSNISHACDPALAFLMADEFRTLLEGMDAAAFLTRLAGGRVSASGGALVASLLESGLFDGKRFSSLCPLSQGTGETGETIYYCAFASGAI